MASSDVAGPADLREWLRILRALLHATLAAVVAGFDPAVLERETARLQVACETVADDGYAIAATRR
jgi:hypothetical protein